MGPMNTGRRTTLLTYADRLGGDLRGLKSLLGGPLRDFAGVHILPFFVPFDGVDAGFDPVDHDPSTRGSAAGATCAP
jgi:hypothetical protein